jgi:hypothetical protein
MEARGFVSKNEGLEKVHREKFNRGCPKYR